MAEFSVPALIGLDSQIKDRRLQQLYLQRQQAREDYTFERQKKTDVKADVTDAAYANVFGGGVAGAAGAVPAAAQTSTPSSPGAPVSSSAGVAPGEPATTAPTATTSPLTFRPDPAKLRALAATGPEGYKAAAAIMKMNADQVKAAQESVTSALELEGRIISGVRKMPPAQRDAEYQRQKAALAVQGVDTQGFPPAWDEDQANAVITSSMKTAEALGLDQQAANHAETVRHNQAGEHHDAVMEANAAGNLGVARAHLQISRNADARAANAPAGVYPVQSKADYDSLPHGTHYSAPDGTVRIKP
jgi:hypothetical protein